MTITSKYIISLELLLILLTHSVSSQSVILPSAIRAGTDVSRIGIWLIDPHKKQYELNADIDIYKYFITADYGYWRTSLNDAGYDYLMNGWYFRTGIDYNFLSTDPDNHVIFFGIKYSISGFDDSFKYALTDPYYGSFSESLSKKGNTARWIEMNTGIKIRIWNGLYMGWTGRMKFGLNLKAPGKFSSYEIPGYGKTSKTSSWGISYNIYYRFQFRDKPRILPKKKLDE